MRCLVFLVFFSTQFNVLGQNGFINSYDMSLPGLVFTNMKVYGDTVVVTGIGIAPPPQPPVQAILFAKLDTNGNILLQKVIADSLGGNYTPGEYPRGFLKTPDGSGYILLSHVFERKNGVAIKVDNSGNALWVQEYSDDESRQDHYQRIVETEGGFLITGSKQALDYSNNLFVMKTDKMGHRIWEKAYGEDNGRRDYFGNILEINSNEYVIGGSTGDNQNVPWQEWQNTVKIFAIDSLGNEKWSWESSPSLEELWIKGLQRTNNGGWAYATARGEFEPDGHLKRQARFIIRDSSFNIVEERLLDDLDISNKNYLLDMVPSQTGGWIGVGSNFEWVDDPFWAEGHAYGWMVRIDETGDTLWTRYDLAFHDTAETSTTVELHSVVELPSGSIIAAGYYRPFHISGPDLGVLIKVDRDGCLADCSPLNVAEWLDVPKMEVTVFPNPAKNKVTVDMPLPLTTEMGWSLYDAIGQRVLFHTMQKGITSTDIPLKSIPPGPYFWELRNGKGKVGGRKLVVVK